MNVSGIQNTISFSARKKASKVIVPPQNTKPYSVIAEIYQKDQEDLKVKRNAARTLINEHYRDRNTFKEKALIYLPAFSAFLAIKLFGKVKK